MEAMATGLPVITTPNSGTVVRDGIEGFIRPCADIIGLVECVDHLLKDPALRMHMGSAARKRAHAFNLDSYGLSLDGMFRGLLLRRAEINRMPTRAELHNRPG
jgi:glycosyltransferase involved in cell wall biosynthesis